MAGTQVEHPNAAERITAAVGSWLFLGLQSTILIVYVVVNSGLVVWTFVRPFDPFPFVFLNLMLSFQAAYTGPVVLMAQNAQSARDRTTQKRLTKIAEATLSLMEQGRKHDTDMETLFHSVLTLTEGTQDMVEQMPSMIRKIVREEIERRDALSLQKSDSK